MLQAVGIVRVSQVSGRHGENFYSPDQQRDQIASECERRDLELLEVHEELDVSGGKPLDERPGLSRAIKTIEAGDADVLVAAYLDRLTRSVRVREEIVQRVEAANGLVLTVDMGVQTNGTASQWLMGTVSSAMGEYHRRAYAERSAEAQQRAIDRGVPPFPGVPPGYKGRVVGRASNGRKIHGPLEIDPDVAPIIRRAFEMRARGATIKAIREYLRENGIKRSYHGVQNLLRSRVYLGELHFGRYRPNLEAHPRLLDDLAWKQTQAASGKAQGRRASSDRLLARLGVLRCGTCDGRMVVGSSNHGQYPIYRCTPTSDCPRRVTISAAMVEGEVTRVVKDALRGIVGKASTASEARASAVAVERAQADLDAAIRTFAGLEDEPVATERIADLRKTRDEAVAYAQHLSGLSAAFTVTVDDWDSFMPGEKRSLIRAVVDRATVAPGRGVDRISINLRVD